MTPEETIHAFLVAALPGTDVYGGRLPAGWSGDDPACVWTLASQSPSHARAPLTVCIVYVTFYGLRDDATSADAMSWAAYEALHGTSGTGVLHCTCVTRGMAATDPETAWPVARATYQMRLIHETA